MQTLPVLRFDLHILNVYPTISFSMTVSLPFLLSAEQLGLAGPLKQDT